MRDRVAALLGRPVEGWWLGTFHALAARLLRRHAELVGLKPNFTILDTDDQLRLLKQLMQAEDLDAKKWPARAMLASSSAGRTAASPRTRSPRPSRRISPRPAPRSTAPTRSGCGTLNAAISATCCCTA